MPFARPAFALLFAGLGLSACASNEPPSEPAETTADRSSYLEASCPADVPYVLPERIDLGVSPVSWGTPDPADYFQPLKPVGLFELTSKDVRVGGLSGLDFLDDDTLVAVSDQGALVWIDIVGDDGQPGTTAYATFLKDEDGQPLDGKRLTDAEGVAWNGETLFISFERTHRVLAYDIEACGAMARGIPYLAFEPTDFLPDRSIKDNNGIEGLASFGTDRLILGIETRNGADGMIGVSGPDGSVRFDQGVRAPEIMLLTGLDYISDEAEAGRLYSLFRSYDPIRGNRIALQVSPVDANGEIGPARRLTLFGTDVTVDNFEGIAVQPVSAQTDRIFVISDDNFSSRQRTLLAVYEYQHDRD